VAVCGAQQLTTPLIGLSKLRVTVVRCLPADQAPTRLNQIGYVEGRNIVIEYGWARNEPDRLPVLVADLVSLQVTVVVAAGLLAALAAKAATTRIPISVPRWGVAKSVAPASGPS
jgi:putative ABC transport system substrate-binding protein